MLLLPNIEDIETGRRAIQSSAGSPAVLDEMGRVWAPGWLRQLPTCTQMLLRGAPPERKNTEAAMVAEGENEKVAGCDVMVWDASGMVYMMQETCVGEFQSI